MTDTRLPISGNIQVRWHAVNAFSNPAKPTAAEINSGLKITDNISWNDWGFGMQASNTNKDPSLASSTNTADRGAAQFGGNISLYLPKDFSDTSNTNQVAWNALKTPRTIGWVSIQIDGKLSKTNTPSYSGGMTQTAAHGDFVSLYKVITGGYTNNITGDQAFRQTINLVQQGQVYPYTVVGITSGDLVVLPSTLASTAGDVDAATATLDGRVYTGGVTWTTSDPAVATVSQRGVITSVAAGSANITATHEASGLTDTVAVTVS